MIRHWDLIGGAEHFYVSSGKGFLKRALSPPVYRHSSDLGSPTFLTIKQLLKAESPPVAIVGTQV